MNSQHIVTRVNALRDVMRREGVHAFFIPSSDPHCGEYVPAHYQSRAWISGFDGSAGTAVVTLDDARLWTDSRYFIAATQQLAGTPFTLMRDGVADTPSIEEWLCATLPAGAVVAADGWVCDYGTLTDLRAQLAAAHITLRTDLDLIAEVWVDERPPLPSSPIEPQPLAYAGESVASKISRLRDIMTKHNADELIVSALDDVAWACNIRGTDVHRTPLAVSYLVVKADTATLYINPSKVTAQMLDTLRAEGIDTDHYNNIHSCGNSVIVSTACCNYALVQQVIERGAHIIDANPVAELKAIKNSTEITGFRHAMLRDGVALVKFRRWIDEIRTAGKLDTLTELAVDSKLTALRAEQALFRDLSFDTIAAYGAHAAIVHYEPTTTTDIPLEPHGLLLLDSGAQYQDGTTDITRTIPLGPLTEQERVDYTLVLKGHIALAKLRFPEATAGTRIDAFARYALWQQGLDYGHGTGHGVGSYLSVHEGPQQIRHTWRPYGLRPGMTITNEPGIYREGSHGIRIENTMLVVSDGQTEYGSWCRLEALTLCPIDTEPIILDMMSDDEIAYLNDYHHHVYDLLAPHLNDDERQWLREATKIIEK